MSIENFPKIYLYRRVVQAKLYIDTHYESNIDLGKIADEAYFSKFHFIRLFKKIYAKTPHQYLTAVRIAKARQLLSAGTGIADTCYAVGFDSIPSFTTLFKKLAGITPLVYQQQRLQLLENIKEAPLEFIPNCFAAANGWSENSNSGKEKQ
jgi:AraC-like DNA-binding protein